MYGLIASLLISIIIFFIVSRLEMRIDNPQTIRQKMSGYLLDRYLQAIMENPTRLDIIKTLIKDEINITIKDKTNRTFLHYAVVELLRSEHFDKEIFVLLLQNGINVNVVDIDGNNALYYFLDEINKREMLTTFMLREENVSRISYVVDLLFQNGIKFNIKNKIGLTASDYIHNNFYSYSRNFTNCNNLCFLINIAAKEKIGKIITDDFVDVLIEKKYIYSNLYYWLSKVLRGRGVHNLFIKKNKSSKLACWKKSFVWSNLLDDSCLINKINDL